MKFPLFTALLWVFALGAFAQKNISGVATYKTVSQSPIRMENTNMDPEQKKMFQARIAKAMQKEYELVFDRSQALYSEVEELEKEGERGMRFLNMFTGAGSLIYKNLSEQVYLKQTEFFGKKFLITDSIAQLNWQLGKESKTIGKYLCSKASAQHIVTLQEMSQDEQGQRNSVTRKDTIHIVAWYTLQVPVSHGPDKYGGLPGLILELNDGVTTMLCSKVSLSTQDPPQINKPNSGEVVSQKEFEEITLKKIEEMQKMYGGQGRGSGHGSMQFRIGG